MYTEELVDLALVNCRRIENRILGTVEFAETEEAEPVLRIQPGHHLVLKQMQNHQNLKNFQSRTALVQTEFRDTSRKWRQSKAS